MNVVALVGDLMDRSRVSAVVPGVRFATSASALVGAASSADLVIVDLGRPGALDAARGLVARGVGVVAYAAHVAGDLLESARAAGCTALPRSVFFRRLPTLVAGRPPGHTAPR